MDPSFYKLRLCSSDILLVDDLDGNGRDRDWEALAKALLPRRRGAGADRLAVVSRAERDIWLRVFRRGGEGGPAADAALCAARYLLDSGRSGAESVRMRVPGLGESGEIEVDVLDSASLGLRIGPPRRVARGRAGEPAGRAGDGGRPLLGPAEAGSLATTIEAEGRRYQVLPLRAGLPGTDAVAVFADRGASAVRARFAVGSGGEEPEAVVVRVLHPGELSVSAKLGRSLDACAAAGLALAAAAGVGYAEREGLARFGKDGIWVEWTQRGWLYAAGRPEYVYRGEFHINDR